MDAKYGGLVFADENGQFGPLQSFLYLYLPTIVSLCSGMFYAWIDLDMRRLEPFFQLSKTHRALAEDSLLLQWLLGFLAFGAVSSI